jgi:hypothetical protein
MCSHWNADLVKHIDGRDTWECLECGHIWEEHSKLRSGDA